MFTFKPAVREQVGLLIALAGASGSGKTFSGLQLATGLTRTGKIAFIDTEARRGLHYATQFDFLHADMRPPFRPERFTEAIRAAEQAGADVVVIDSMSHEYDGEGGIMDWADELAERGVKSPGNWKEPKLAHKRMMNSLLQARAHLIFCLRADEKIEIIREGGKTQVRPLGWMPICEKRFMYEMTASFTLLPSRPGRPFFDLPHKLQQQHRAYFPEGELITAEAARALRDWAEGGTPRGPAISSGDREGAASVQSAVDPAEAALLVELAREGQDAAERGTAVLEAFWRRLTKPQRQALAGNLDAWKVQAREIDELPSDTAEEPSDAHF